MTRNIDQDTPLFRISIAHSRAARNIHTFREQVLQPHSISSPEWLVLGYVASQTDQNGTKVGHIATVLDVQSTYVTGILRKLEAKVLINSRTDTQDRRARIITATKEGLATAKAIDAELTKRGEAWLGKIPATTMQHYMDVLERFARKPSGR